MNQGSGGRDADGGAGAPLSIGRYLASQRKLRGISLDELAARTRIPRRNLERLESGAFDGQPDGFVRGFVRTVAEALGLDPQEAVMRLVGEPAGAGEEWRRQQWIRRGVVAVVAGGIALVALGWGFRLATRWVVEPSGGAPEAVYRRDAVRWLAEQADAAPVAEAETPAETAAGPLPPAGP